VEGNGTREFSHRNLISVESLDEGRNQTLEKPSDVVRVSGKREQSNGRPFFRARQAFYVVHTFSWGLSSCAPASMCQWLPDLPEVSTECKISATVRGGGPRHISSRIAGGTTPVANHHALLPMVSAAPAAIAPAPPVMTAAHHSPTIFERDMLFKTIWDLFR
jgi:hypothetical protein